ncbi:hypothetical protein PMAYCL1PPCAC_01151, partial [Pristionchus mayeri]
DEDLLEVRSVLSTRDNLFTSMDQGKESGVLVEDSQLFIADQPNMIKEEHVNIKDETIDEFAEVKLEEPLGDRELDECTDKKKLTQPRKCYLCGEMALPWLITPKDPFPGHLFFMSLIELTDDQLELIDHLIKFNKRANICRKHYREPTLRNFDFMQAQHANMKGITDEYDTLNEDGLITKQPCRDIPWRLFSAPSINIVPQRKTEMCFLCYRSSSKCYATPMEPTQRMQFLNKVIVESSGDKERVEMLMNIKSR